MKNKIEKIIGDKYVSECSCYECDVKIQVGDPAWFEVPSDSEDNFGMCFSLCQPCALKKCGV